MLQFISSLLRYFQSPSRFNPPTVLETHILQYLTPEELIGYCHLSDKKLLHQPIFNITQETLPDFKKNLCAVVQETLNKLIHDDVPFVRQPGDRNHIVLARTIQALEAEKEKLLANDKLTNLQKTPLRESALDSVEGILHLNNLLNKVNMDLALAKFPVNRENVTIISLYNLSLTRLPPQLIEKLLTYPGLRTLYLAFNKLTTLPESFGNLTALTELCIPYNQLTTLPESFGNLTALTELAVERNQLTALPESFRNLTALTTLRVDLNPLTHYPSEAFSNPTTLTELRLPYDQLTTLPKALRSLLINTNNSGYLTLIRVSRLTSSSSSSISSSVSSSSSSSLESTMMQLTLEPTSITTAFYRAKNSKENKNTEVELQTLNNGTNKMKKQKKKG